MSWSGKTRTVSHAQSMELCSAVIYGPCAELYLFIAENAEQSAEKKNRSSYGGNRTKIQQKYYYPKSRMHTCYHYATRSCFEKVVYLVNLNYNSNILGVIHKPCGHN